MVLKNRKLKNSTERTQNLVRLSGWDWPTTSLILWPALHFSLNSCFEWLYQLAKGKMLVYARSHARHSPRFYFDSFLVVVTLCLVAGKVTAYLWGNHINKRVPSPTWSDLVAPILTAWPSLKLSNPTRLVIFYARWLESEPLSPTTNGLLYRNIKSTSKVRVCLNIRFFTAPP